MASNNYIYKMSNAGGMSTITRYTDMLAGNTVWNPWEPQGAYDALSTVTVPSGGVASITFAGIPQTYKHLQVRYLAQASSGNITDSIRVRFNGDTGTNYAYHALYGTGSGSALAAGSTGNSWANAGQLALSTTTFSSGVIDILDYNSSAKNKTVRSLSGVDFNGSGVIALESNVWLNTSPITSITIPYVSNFAQNSQFTLYGVK
jgi:hypothetical protein